MKRALIAFLLCTPAYAGPLATCKDGICTMQESDYVRLQEFHRLTRKGVEAMEAHISEQDALIVRLYGEANSCKSRLPRKEI